jgi:hypothetical protein
MFDSEMKMMAAFETVESTIAGFSESVAPAPAGENARVGAARLTFNVARAPSQSPPLTRGRGVKAKIRPPKGMTEGTL